MVPIIFVDAREAPNNKKQEPNKSEAEKNKIFKNGSHNF